MLCGAPLVCLFFFFQAEDGIRDLVRSRGLGDVYKRQAILDADGNEVPEGILDALVTGLIGKHGLSTEGLPVSYTHLTLPTSDLV